MPVTQEEREDALIERRERLGQQQNYCPFGCNFEDLDEYGYCRHLKGFTNDGVTMETVQTRVKEEGPVGKYVSCKHKAAVLATDRLVNIEYVQVDKGIKSIAKKWVSDRVYRDDEPKKK